MLQLGQSLFLTSFQLQKKMPTLLCPSLDPKAPIWSVKETREVVRSEFNFYLQIMHRARNNNIRNSWAAYSSERKKIMTQCECGRNTLEISFIFFLFIFWRRVWLSSLHYKERTAHFSPNFRHYENTVAKTQAEKYIYWGVKRWHKFFSPFFHSPTPFLRKHAIS